MHVHVADNFKIKQSWSPKFYLFVLGGLRLLLRTDGEVRAEDVGLGHIGLFAGLPVLALVLLLGLVLARGRRAGPLLRLLQLLLLLPGGADVAAAARP